VVHWNEADMVPEQEIDGVAGTREATEGKQQVACRQLTSSTRVLNTHVMLDSQLG
jgi:hypothetical protein